MDLTVAGASFAFSDQVESVCGKGVNVYAGVEWGSVDLLWRIHYELRYRAFSIAQYDLSEAQKTLIESKKRTLIEQFALVTRHRMLRLRPVPWVLLRRQIELAPSTFRALYRVHGRKER